MSGVTIAPEYRGRGVGRSLVMALTELMAARGYLLSVLYPTTMHIYRRLGWELGSHHYAFLAPDGFAAYRWRGDNEIYVDRLLAATPDTTLALWSIVASHSSVASTVVAQVAPRDPLWWLQPEQDAVVSERDPWMLRLLDAPAAIAARGFRAVDIDVPLHITDQQLPHNRGRWDLTVRSSGEAHLLRTPAGAPAQPALALGARGLAALYAGTPVSTLRRAGLASGGTPEADAALDGAFAAAPYMLDDF
jgi:predicted acetyltransferase